MNNATNKSIKSLGRRAQAEMLEWFPRLILLTVATVLLVVITSYYAGREVDSAEVEMNAHFYRIYYDDILMYKDPVTNRVYPGIIDKSKFTETRLTDIFKTKDSTGESRVASCYGLWYPSKLDAPVEKICTDKGMVDHFLPIAENNWIGAGAAKFAKFTMPVTVMDVSTGTTEPAYIEVTIVKRNT